MIPDSFMLAGIPVSVIVDNTFVQQHKTIGEANYSRQQITIDKSAAPKALTEQSFLHEVTHWILYMMGEDDLRNNEKFVDTFAHFWYQYETTKEYKEPNGTEATEGDTTDL